MQIDRIEFLNTYQIFGRAMALLNGNSALIGPYADSAIKALRWCVHEGNDWRKEWMGITNSEAFNGPEVRMAAAIVSHEPQKDSYRLLRTASDSMGMRMFGSHMMPELLQGTYLLSVGFGKSTEEVQRGKLETSAFALRKVLGDSDLFALVHSGRSDALPTLWKADTPDRYSALLKDACSHENVSISLRGGDMFASVDGSARSLASLELDELYITSLALSIVQRKRKDMQVPYIVLLPSSLRPGTRLDAARLCALAGGQIVIISQELERDAVKMIGDIELIPIIPDRMNWGKLPW